MGVDYSTPGTFSTYTPKCVVVVVVVVVVVFSMVVVVVTCLSAANGFVRSRE